MSTPEQKWWEGCCYAKSCVEDAELLMDGVPFCIQHADDHVERANAIGNNPTMREVMEPLPLKIGARWQ